MSKENDDNNQETSGVKEQRADDLPEVEQELSKVAANPKQSMIILVGISLIFLYIFYSFFLSGDDEGAADDNVPVPTEVVRPAEIGETSDNVPSIPTLPSPPKLEDPSLPPPPPLNTSGSDAAPLPSEASGGILPPTPDGGLLPLPGASLEPTLPITSTSSDNARGRIEQKRKAPIILVAGANPTKTPEQVQQEADFKMRGDMNLILSRGKLIDTIVESAVNSDFGGEVRGVISRDVYSEWGKNILIPKGSKIYGTYASGFDGNMARIAIEWVRIDLINGYTINFAGTSTDALGRKGVPGRLDNKFKERFSNAVLRSAFNVALANVLDSIVTPQINSQAAATQNTQATSIRNIANNATANSEQEATNQITAVCANVQNAITDKTSTAFTAVQTACNSAISNAGGNTAEQRLGTLRNAINSAADSLIQVTNESVEPTKAQQASEQAFTDLSDQVKDLVEEQELKPTVTIQQGTKIKIYVNRDYRFPKAAVGRARVVK